MSWYNAFVNRLYTVLMMESCEWGNNKDYKGDQRELYYACYPRVCHEKWQHTLKTIANQMPKRKCDYVINLHLIIVINKITA